RAEQQGRGVDDEAGREPADAGLHQNASDVAEIALPKKEADEKDREQRDQRKLENALQSRRVLPQRSMVNIYTHPIFYKHETGAGHPETAARIDAAIEGVRRAGMTDRIVREPQAHPATHRIIAKVHSEDYEQELDQACRDGYQLFHSIDNP